MRNLVLTQIDGISHRAVACCNDVGILTLGDLFDYMRCRSLTTIKNCGIKTAKELSHIMSRYEKQVLGFKYDLFAVSYDDEAAEPEAIFQPLPALHAIADANSVTVEVLNTIYLEALTQMPVALSALIKNTFQNVNQLLDPIIASREAVFDRHEGWSFNDHFRFWEFCQNLFITITERLDQSVCPVLCNKLTSAAGYVRSRQNMKKLSFVHSKLTALLEQDTEQA